MKEVFGPDGLIARYHPNYEYRPGQIEMAHAVHDTLTDGGVALIEAGTGTGKTLAYLIPALAAGRRVIVSTATKNLQEQLIKKDIPFLQTVIKRDFKTVCMKGRANYICLHKLKKAESQPIFEDLQDVNYFDTIRRWAGKTETGDRAELTDLPENLPFWHQIDARAESCIGQKCPDYDECFITRMRQEAMESDVVIVNHHLFFADLALRGGDFGAVLPDYSTIIFDEAHEIEDVAASYFGCSVSNFRIADLIQDAQKLVISEPDAVAELVKSLARLSQRSDAFWATFYPRDKFAQDGRYTLSEEHFVKKDRDDNLVPSVAGEAYVALINAVNRVAGALGVVKDPPSELDNILRRVEVLKFELEFIVSAQDPGFVYWYECRGRGVFVHGTPIDVSGILEERLFSNVQSAVLTSATMTAGNSFDFIKGRLGISHSRDLIIESHFDYENQSVLYLPKRLPDPRSPQFNEASALEIIKILRASNGRAFVLFTSVAAMNQVFDLVFEELDFPMFKQGQGSKIGLLERFRKTPNAVLFATSSFWQGVDVQGEALSCVVIHKLPFAVPTDPVVAARQKYIDDNGGNSFMEYSVPQAAIILKQGLGRLIRSATDKGVLSVLDPRIQTKFYGKVFIKSIPSCRITDRIEEATAIFDDKK
ncbi:MAG: ATP-dependent DNA helicase [Acidobacteriota bacterium]